MLGIVLPNFQSLFGIPINVLHTLAAIPVAFLLFDLFAAARYPNRTNHYLRAIAVANLAYCIFSLSLVGYHFDTVTGWGWYYIVSEILIVAGVAILELTVAGRLRYFQTIPHGR